MEKKTRRAFSKEFKVEAVRMGADRPVAEVARSRGLHGNSLYRWQEALSTEGPEALHGRGN